MEDKLLEIAKLMDNFSKEYNRRIDIERYESRFVDEKESRIIYKLKAVKPEQTLIEIVSQEETNENIINRSAEI